LSEPFQEAIFSLQGIGVVSDIRGQGLLAAIELAEDGAPGRRGYRVLQKLFAAGLLVRVTADTVILAPPFVIQETQLHQVAELLRKVLDTE